MNKIVLIMKKIILVIALNLTFIMLSKAQEFENFYSISAYVGIQSPTEIAYLDFGGSGVSNVFGPGIQAGVSLNRDWKRLKISFHSDYLRNKMNIYDEEPEDNYLNNIQTKGMLWFNFLSAESKLKFHVGVGAGIIFFKYPSVTYTWGPETDNPGQVEVWSPFWSGTPSLNSGFNLTYQINEKLYLSASQTNDFVLFYGEEETAILNRLVLGIQRAF